MGDRSTPARLSLGQCATDRFSPTATKYESRTGDCTAITRQFAQSSPSIRGSIWSRRGNCPPRAISFQSRSTRSTSRRLNKTIIVSESMLDISSVSGNITASTEVFSVASLCASRAAFPVLPPASTQWSRHSRRLWTEKNAPDPPHFARVGSVHRAPFRSDRSAPRGRPNFT